MSDALGRELGREQEASARETLTRVLASESRNALARVELAASELARFEISPAQMGRVATIREAVSEIDLLLGKIDLLSEPQRGAGQGRTDFVHVAREVFSGLSVALAARGLHLDLTGIPANPSERIAVVVPRAKLESIFFGVARIASRLIESPGALEVRALKRDEYACLLFRCSDDAAALASGNLDREARLELEVELAEWGGVLLSSTGTWPRELGFALPLETSTCPR